MQTQVVTLDVLKPIGTIVDLSDSFNARVGDKMTPFQLFITEGGVAKDLKGMHPELEAEVGNGALRNGVAVMAAGAKGVHWVGSTNNVTGYNQLTLAFPAELFPQSGFCYGHLILANDAGVRETSVDIWFQVLDGTPLMGLVADHYDSELQLELAKARNANDQFSQEMRDTYNQQVIDAQNAMEKATSDLKHLAVTTGSIQAQIDAKNFVTFDKYRHEIEIISEMIEAKLAQMNLTPETFPNATAIQDKYPKGKAGLFIAEDTGHKWIYYQGTWTDAGVYQGVGVADRSLTALKMKQLDVLYHVVQANPIVVDWDNHQLVIDKNIFLMEDKNLIELSEGKYAWDSSYTTVYVGYNAESLRFDFVDANNVSKLPDNDYFIGVFDSYSKMVSSLFKITESTNVWHDGTKTLIQNSILPPLQQAICTATDDDIHVDFVKRTLTLYSTIHLYSKTHALKVDPGTFTLNDKGLASFIYADWSDDDKEYILKAVPEITDVPDNGWYLGWIDYYRKSSYFNQVGTNSTEKIKPANLTIAGKITVDFENKEIIFPRNFDGFNFNLKLPKDYQHPVRVPLKVTGKSDNGNVYYLAVDPKNADHIEISSDYGELSYNCQIIGWVNLSAHYYDFGKYGNSADLASQPFINQKVTCLGDSITSGGQTDNGGMAISYVDYLETLIGTKPTNAGVSGSHITKSAAGRTDSFVERVESIKNQDAITIYGGVNDFLFDSPLGTMTDEATTQTTFYGALKYLVTRLTFNNPDAKLLFITPMKADKYGGTYDVNGNVRKNSVNATEEDYVNAIKEVASYYSIPVLDLFHDGNLNPYIPAQNTMTVDGLHPNEKGAQRLAKTIAHAINNL
ncbi:SGNH/GDSL hydrolase family protein [Limosilactobacillus reuteri]